MGKNCADTFEVTETTRPLQIFYAVASSNSSNVIVLFLAQVMGTYFCAMVILMRMNMPLEYRCVCAWGRAVQKCELSLGSFIVYSTDADRYLMCTLYVI